MPKQGKKEGAAEKHVNGTITSGKQDVVNTPDSVEASANENGSENRNGNGKGTPVPEEKLVHLIVFKLGAENYAIKIDQVKEVTITPEITRMPRTPDFVKGVANIRGDIIAIVDLEQRFGIRPAPASEEFHSNMTYTLVIEAQDYSIGVVVKEMPQSLNLSMSKIDKAPSFLQDTSVHESYIEGIAKVDGRLIIVLDMHRILTTDEIKQLTD